MQNISSLGYLWIGFLNVCMFTTKATIFDFFDLLTEPTMIELSMIDSYLIMG